MMKELTMAIMLGLLFMLGVTLIIIGANNLSKPTVDKMRYTITLECQKMYASTNHPDKFSYSACLRELTNSLTEPAKK